MKTESISQNNKFELNFSQKTLAKKFGRITEDVEKDDISQL